MSLHCLQLDDQLLPSSLRIHQDSLTANTYSQCLWYIDTPCLQQLQVFSTGQTPTTDIRNDWGSRGQRPRRGRGVAPLAAETKLTLRNPWKTAWNTHFCHFLPILHFLATTDASPSFRLQLLLIPNNLNLSSFFFFLSSFTSDCFHLSSHAASSVTHTPLSPSCIPILFLQQSDSNFLSNFTDELRDQTSVIQLETVDYALQPPQKQQRGRKEPTKAYELLAHLSGMPL